MDYLTRRSVAQSGAIGSWLGTSRHPCIGGIGLRVEDGCVARAEVAQAARDLAKCLLLSVGIDRALERYGHLLLCFIECAGFRSTGKV